MRKKLRQLSLFCWVMLLPVITDAQDSSHLRISLLTCTPGDELYSTFGHSALRITDSTVTVNGAVQDIVFNYGTFNFDDPHFYTSFIRGKLLYFVSTAYFNEFKLEYQTTGRGITEQVLNFTGAEKEALRAYLLNNIKEENKYYKYDFLFDNCTTRLRDIIVQHKRNKPYFEAIVPPGTTFRNSIHAYLDRNDKEWSKLGIDILLGEPTDAVMNISQSQFLPDNLMKALDSSNHDNHLVLSKSELYAFDKPAVQPSWFNPVIFFSALLLLVALLDWSKNKMAAAFLYGFDGLLFFVTGAIGILLLFMWFGTDHSMCKNNYNLIWAWPTHAIAAFFINSRKRWLKTYLLFTMAGFFITMAAWIFLPQQLNNSLLAVCLLLLYRSIRKYNAI